MSLLRTPNRFDANTSPNDVITSSKLKLKTIPPRYTNIRSDAPGVNLLTDIREQLTG